MAARIKIFLRNVPPDLTSKSVEKGIAQADWWTLGEDYEVSEEDVDAFIDGLRWTDDPLELRLDGHPPVRIECHRDLAYVHALVEELDQFQSLTIPKRVRHHLGAVQAVVTIEMGVSQLRTMFEIVGFEVAYWLAREFDGLILSDDHLWFDHQSNRWDPIQDSQ